MKPRILVVGDAIADCYVQGRVGRISTEAPVPVLARDQAEQLCPGGGLNVAANAAALGAKVTIVSLVGGDVAGEEVRRALERRGVDIQDLGSAPGLATITKTRFVSRGQHIIRVDQDAGENHYSRWSVAIHEALARALVRHDYDIVLLSDYGKGSVSPNLIRSLVRASRERGFPVVVDPCGRDIQRYRGLWGLKANRTEAEALLDRPLANASALADGARSLQAGGFEAVWITLGAEGCVTLYGDDLQHHPSRARSVFDVTGAGDTFLAALGVALVPARDPYAATAFANLAGGLAVAKAGTSVVHRDEVLRENEPLDLDRMQGDGLSRLLDLETAADMAGQCRDHGLRIGFTNGCFDLLHPGHANALGWIARRVDVLFVGLNSDGSVRRQKGADRPVYRLADRARLLLALRAVTFVVPFPEDTPERLIGAVQPDILFKGEDWAHFVSGRELVESRGGRVELIPLTPGYSTTRILERIAGRPR